MKESSENGYGGGQEKEPMSLETLLAYVQQLGEDIAKNAQNAQAMLAIAQERGQKVDLVSNETVAKFTPPNGEHEIALVRIRASVNEIASAMSQQGVLVSQADLNAQLEKMRLKH